MTAARPSKRYTFRARLTATMTSLALGVLAAAGTILYVGVRQVLLLNLDGALLSIARAEIASVLDQPGGRIHVHEEVLTPLSLTADAAYEKFARIKDASGKVRSQTSNLAEGPDLETDPKLEARALAGGVSFADVRRGTDTCRAVYYPLKDPAGSHLLVLVALSKRPMDRSLNLLLVGILGMLAVGGLGAAWGASRLASGLTRPLERIAEAVGRVGEQSLNARIPPVSPDVELCAVADRLNEMLDRLEAAFLAQRRFVTSASHELRSPLSNLRGTIEVALRRPRSPEDYRKTLVAALAEIERLSRLVSGLLTLSRFDSGQPHMGLAPCDLGNVARQSAGAHAARAEEAGVQIRFQRDDHQPLEIRGDPDRLREVVDNLLDNALRYGPPGSAIVVSTRQDGAWVTVSVEDAGPGLTAEEQTHVFERFYRTDPSRARESGGLGLGLSIARAIVEAHRGRISVRSEPGKGCVFSVALPAVPAPGDAPLAKDVPSRPGCVQEDS